MLFSTVGSIIRIVVALFPIVRLSSLFPSLLCSHSRSEHRQISRLLRIRHRAIGYSDVHRRRRHRRRHCDARRRRVCRCRFVDAHDACCRDARCWLLYRLKLLLR